MIIFSEACTHGTWPWRTQHERRSLLYKFCPGHMAWAWASPYPSPADAPEIDYSEQLRRILDAPDAAPGQDAFGENPSCERGVPVSGRTERTSRRATILASYARYRETIFVARAAIDSPAR